MLPITSQPSLLSQIPSVAVIMSTYNGEKYLNEQIDSILSQKDVHVELFIRDDGSTDRTRVILSEYEKKYENIHVNYSYNVGCGGSFLRELKAVTGFNYYAFSDQDDYWEKEKLISAVKAISHHESIHGRNIPVLWYSNVNVADKNLNILQTTRLEKRIHSLERSILRMSVPGCAMVINKYFHDLIASKPLTDEVTRLYLHDSLIMYLVNSARGIMICDFKPYTYYRQHGKNTEGHPTKLIPRIYREWNNFMNNPRKEAEFAEVLLNVWGDAVTPEARKTLTITAGYKENIFYRLRIVLSPKFRTGDIRLTTLGKLKALFGKL